MFEMSFIFFCNLKKWNNNVKNPLGFDPNDRGRIKIDAIINCVNRESNFRRNINDQFGLRLNTYMRNILHLVLLDLLLGSIILFIMLESIWNVNKKGSYRVGSNMEKKGVYSILGLILLYFYKYTFLYIIMLFEEYAYV